MTLEEAKIQKIELNKEVDMCSDILNSFPTNGLGLVPDNVRESQEWKDADRNFKIAFSNLRNFNSWYMKEFRKKKKR